MQRSAVWRQPASEQAWLDWPELQQAETLDLATLMSKMKRAVVVAPHPDDEILGMGGTIHLLARSGLSIHLYAVTDGDASHHPSRRHPPRRLASARAKESERAFQVLGVGPMVQTRLRIPDGKLAQHERQLYSSLTPELCRDDVVFTTFRADRHPDHEATGRAVAAACERVGCKLIEFPIWTWQWSRPGDTRVPWNRTRTVALDAAALRSKRRAIEEFTSQLRRSRTAPATPILPQKVLRRFQRDFEVFFV